MKANAGGGIKEASHVGSNTQFEVEQLKDHGAESEAHRELIDRRRQCGQYRFDEESVDERGYHCPFLNEGTDGGEQSCVRARGDEIQKTKHAPSVERVGQGGEWNRQADSNACAGESP